MMKPRLLRQRHPPPTPSAVVTDTRAPSSFGTLTSPPTAIELTRESVIYLSSAPWNSTGWAHGHDRRPPVV